MSFEIAISVQVSAESAGQLPVLPSGVQTQRKMMVSDWQGAILRSYQVRTTQVDTRNADQGIPGDWNPVQIDGML